MRAPQQGMPLQNQIFGLPVFDPGQDEWRIVLICCFSFLFGYVPGILLWRTAEPLYGTELVAWCIDASRYTHWEGVLFGLSCAAFIQLTGLFLCGFCVFGLFFLLMQFSLRGAWLGFCAAGVYRLHGLRALLKYRVLDSPADLLLLFACLYLSIQSAKSARWLYGAVFMPPGFRKEKLMPHRFFYRYLFVLLLAETACCVCAAFSVLFAGFLY